MPDNVSLPAATGKAASREVTYSGETAQAASVGLVLFTGADDAKVATDVSDTAPLPIKEIDGAVASTANSTTANLAGAAVFTGTSEDVHDYAQIAVSVFSSHASATDGLALQQSSDGVNWDLSDTFTIPAATGKTFSIGVQARFFRLVYTNGATLTTSLRIQTLFSKMYKKGSSVRPQDGRANENDFEESLSYLMGYNSATWDRLKATLGALHVTAPDITASGTLTAAAQLVNLPLNGQSSAVIQITGTWVGTIQFEGTTGGVTFDPINGVFAATSAPATTATVNGSYRITPGALASIQARMSSFTSGSATIAIRASTGVGGTFANQIVPVRSMNDAGRNSRSFMLDVYTAAPVAEALQSVVQWYGNAAVAGTTTPAVVPTGKTLRLTNWAISTKALATFGSAVLRIRANTGGVAVIGSPLVWSAEVGGRVGATTVSATGHLDQQTGAFAEGFEFQAGTGLGFTLAGYGPTGTLTLQGVTRFQVFGYEY